MFCTSSTCVPLSPVLLVEELYRSCSVAAYVTVYWNQPQPRTSHSPPPKLLCPAQLPLKPCPTKKLICQLKCQTKQESSSSSYLIKDPDVVVV